MSGGEHEGGDLCADEEGWGEQAHGQDQDERAQQSLPHNIQVSQQQSVIDSFQPILFLWTQWPLF